MDIINGGIRFLLIIIALLIASLLVLLTFLLPIQIQQVHVSSWITHYTARLILWLGHVTVKTDNLALIRSHEGYLFSNHASLVDILVILGATPVRFLAKSEVRRVPLIGFLAAAVGCVFVDRKSKASRLRAREQLKHLSPLPPISVYPEGKRGPGGATLLPFRYGAFQLAIDTDLPFLPCAILYSPWEPVVKAPNESGLISSWRILTWSGKQIEARLIPLDPVQVTAVSDPAQLAEATREAITAVIQQNQTHLVKT